MSRVIMLVLIVFFATCGYADMMKGKKLFENAKCMECHHVGDFKDKKIRKSKTFAQMKDKVSACQIQNDAQWFDEDEHDVAVYLNKKYYHFIQQE